MPTKLDVENQLAEYCSWLEERLATSLSPSEQPVALDESGGGRRGPNPGWVLAAAASAVVAVSGIAVLASNEGQSRIQGSPTAVTEPASSEVSAAAPTAATTTTAADTPVDNVERVPAETGASAAIDLPSVTGYHVGDQVRADGGIGPRTVGNPQAWFAVSIDGIVVGYTQIKLDPPPASPGVTLDPYPAMLIYGERGQRVGEFINGEPVLD